MCRLSDSGRVGGRWRRRHAVRADQRLHVVEHLGCRALAAGGVKAAKPAWPRRLRREGTCLRWP